MNGVLATKLGGRGGRVCVLVWGGRGRGGGSYPGRFIPVT